MFSVGDAWFHFGIHSLQQDWKKLVEERPVFCGISCYTYVGNSVCYALSEAPVLCMHTAFGAVDKQANKQQKTNYVLAGKEGVCSPPDNHPFLYLLHWLNSSKA